MSKELAVYLNQTYVGLFKQDIHGKNSFTYDANYLVSPHAQAISNILPLRVEPFKHNICHAFFAGILPEDTQRRIIARTLGISANNDFSLLEKIGGECAGALCFLPPNIPFTDQHYDYTLIPHNKLQELLEELPRRPLLAGQEGIRISLAGVQDKIPVAILNNEIYLPINGAPSTHIIKPSIAGYSFDTVLNEAYCLKLAQKIGLHVAECDIGDLTTIKYLSVKRYDRIVDGKKIIRLQQEDFCQALNIASENKYQNEGGPALTDCFKLLRNVSNDVVTDITRLLDGIIYNYIIGNCDAHGKNFSLLYKNDSIRLAPLYDLLSTIIYPELSNKMAMKIGKEYNINQINKDCFVDLSKAAELNVKLVLARVIELCNAINNNIDIDYFKNLDVTPLQDLIQLRTRDILKIFN